MNPITGSGWTGSTTDDESSWETSGRAALHHQAVDRLGRQLVAVAWADDGTIESIEDLESEIVAVQWHPEQMPDRPEQMRLFSWLIEKAEGHRRSNR